MANPLETLVVNTTDTHADEPVQTYYCTCGWDTMNRRDFQQHLMSGEPNGCKPRDLQIFVTDSIGMDERLG